MRKHIRVILLFLIVVLYAGGYKEASAVGNNSIAVTRENFPDKSLRKEIAKKFDKNSDGILSELEIKGAKELYLGGCYNTAYSTLNIKGISKLRNITSLSIGADIIQNISEFQKMPQLIQLRIGSTNSEIDVLDFSNNINLCRLELRFPIKKIYLTNNKKLEVLELDESKLKEVKISNLPKLQKMYFDDNTFKTLTITKIGRASCRERVSLAVWL